MSRQDARPAITDAPSTPLPDPTGPTDPTGPADPSGLPDATGLRARAARRLDRIRFRNKLNILVVVPLTVMSLLFVLIVANEIAAARAAGDQAQLIRASAQVTQLVDDVQAEHRNALLLWAGYDRRADYQAAPSLDAYQRTQGETDAQAAAVRAAFGSALPDAEASALAQVDSLSSVRAQITAGTLPPENIDSAYGPTADALIDGLGLTSSTGRDARTNETLDALLHADTAHAAFETSLVAAQTGDSNALIEFLAAVGDQRAYTDSAQRFGVLATADQAVQLDGIDHNGDESYLDGQIAMLDVDPAVLEAPTTKRGMADAATQVDQTSPHILGEAATRLQITESLTLQIAAGADDTSSTAWWWAISLLAAALLIFATWLVLSVLIRHSVVRPVQRLTSAARKVAAVSEQELSRVADDDAVDESPARLEAVPVLAQDELGELATAFNQVQVTAAGLLERQVTSRRNIAEMFGNIGRRVSNLTTRQLTLIDAVEREETNPDLLEQLYRIDHIAVRMQRNADSLMLLAGIRESELDGRPASVTHVVRAALGQIEGYQRVQLRVETDATVSPDIVGDLVLMLAELLENAASFSPAHSTVEVAVRVSPDGRALVEIVDHGLGMGSERLAEENARLVRRERLDLVPTKVLGLFVVGTLARRWGVTVVLTRTTGGGVTSLVSVPAALLTAASAPVPAAAATATAAAPTREAPATAPATATSTETPATAAAPPTAAHPAAAPPAATAPPALTGPTPLPHPEPAPTAPGGLPRRTPTRRTADDPTPPAPAAAAPAAGSAAAPTPAGSAPASTPTAPALAGSAAAPASTPTPTAAPAPAAPAAAASAAAPAPAAATHAHAADTSAPAAPAPDEATARPSAPQPPGGSSQLRRRVRGATLNPGSTARPDIIPTAPRTEVDAEAVRSSLEEFEAAVDRAERDSTLTDLRITPPVARPRPDTDPHHDTDPHLELPEGVGP
ncbi:ATP-binding protein [Streptacidiphilus sp. EB129]|uniref:sensor histidine kinase n=1 Tax=Streptacidiphilus sp. EB129 TaxID=3156262 RepID=UPI0035183271